MIPKAELHIHLEAAVYPATAKKLAAANQIVLNENIFGQNEKYNWQTIPEFLAVYDEIASAIRTAQNYRQITYDYLARSAQEGVIYSELTLSPDHAHINGLSYIDMLNSVSEGIDQARADFGIESRIIMTAIRHAGVEQAIKVAELVVKQPHPYVVGFNLSGDEANYPPGQFAKAYEIAKQAKLGCTAHAGEWSGPQSVWEAINTLPITRLGHGVRSIEDPFLVEELIKRNITLEVCLTSNIACNVYTDYANHVFLALRNSGLKVTLNSDDPTLFATTIGDEYQIAQQHLGLSDSELIDITRTAINSSFADEATKQRLLTKL